MIAMDAERVVPLITALRRRPVPARGAPAAAGGRSERVVYELARLRVADTHQPQGRFRDLARMHD
jgi:hypothetical protein